MISSRLSGGKGPASSAIDPAEPPGWTAARCVRLLATALGYAILGIASLLLACIVLPGLRAVASGGDDAEIRAQRILHRWVRAYLRVVESLQIVRIECTGAERLRQPGVLVVANHPTLLDVLALISLMPQADCVVKESYYQNRFLRGVAHAVGYIPKRTGAQVVASCVERLVRGRSLIIFPEGTRSPANGLGRFLRGAAHVALRSGCDPVPVTIRCDPPNLYHGRRWWDVPDGRFVLTLRVGEPLRVKDVVDAEASPPRAARMLTESLHDYFERNLGLVAS